MDIALSRFAATFALGLAVTWSSSGCARTQSPEASSAPRHGSGTEVSDPAAAAKKDLRFPSPEGYEEILGLPDSGQPRVGFRARAQRMGFVPTIVFQRAPVAGGSSGAPSLCAEAAKSIAAGVGGRLTTAGIVDGPAGKSCQFRIVAPEGVALITELNRPSIPETWLMTCNHADGDTVAESVCRTTLAALELDP